MQARSGQRDEKLGLVPLLRRFRGASAELQVRGPGMEPLVLRGRGLQPHVARQRLGAHRLLVPRAQR
jgi:hypothetical protein